MLQSKAKTNSWKYKCYFWQDCVLKDNNEIVSSSKSEGLELESVKDEEEAPKQDQSNNETLVNQEEIRNDQ